MEGQCAKDKTTGIITAERYGKMQNIDIVIYDFDGVIADTATDIAGAIQAAQKQYGKEIMDITKSSLLWGSGQSI